ncbi:DCC-interacting protein 13-alpha, partial [Oryzias melastigma]|uniref:DCC-interacting protein 13-alpha n=1 Tax=Oryzias melastigma TaxID=30732 RepID=UPI000CF7CDF2
MFPTSEFRKRRDNGKREELHWGVVESCCKEVGVIRPIWCPCLRVCLRQQRRTTAAMPGIEKLPLEEALEDSPQTRSLLGVFEEDTAAISNYCTQLYQAMQRIYDAQNELSAATHLTSRLLKEYDKQRFPLGGDDEVMSSTLQQFAKVIDELSSCHAVLSTQLADAMMFPITQFKERDLKELLTLKEVFQIASDDHDTAINRYSRLSKRRDNDKVRAEVVEDVYTSRKKQHQTMMHYFCSLNTLQY